MGTAQTGSTSPWRKSAFGAPLHVFDALGTSLLASVNRIARID